MPLVAKKSFDKNMSNPILMSKNVQASAMELSSNYNKPLVNFKGYFGDKQPAKKLFWILKGISMIKKISLFVLKQISRIS